MPAKKRKTVQVKWVTDGEFNSMVDSRAKRVLGISAKQFITSGRMDDIAN
jgi:hypothetical protein